MLIILLALFLIVVALGLPIDTRPGEDVLVTAEYVGDNPQIAALVARYGAFTVGAAILVVVLMTLIIIIIPVYQFLVSVGIIREWRQQ
jgi:hypothetical protein